MEQLCTRAAGKLPPWLPEPLTRVDLSDHGAAKPSAVRAVAQVGNSCCNCTVQGRRTARVPLAFGSVTRTRQRRQHRNSPVPPSQVHVEPVPRPPSRLGYTRSPAVQHVHGSCVIRAESGTAAGQALPCLHIIKRLKRPHRVLPLAPTPLRPHTSPQQATAAADVDAADAAVAVAWRGGVGRHVGRPELPSGRRRVTEPSSRPRQHPRLQGPALVGQAAPCAARTADSQAP